MTEAMEGMVEAVAVCVELAGVLVIVVGGLVATGLFASDVLTGSERKAAYHGYRANLGRAILLGLELLVAGDIISTILVEPSLEKVAALGLIVLIRTFLSFSLETEIEGVLPWRRNAPEQGEVRGRIDS